MGRSQWGPRGRRETTKVKFLKTEWARSRACDQRSQYLEGGEETNERASTRSDLLPNPLYTKVTAESEKGGSERQKGIKGRTYLPCSAFSQKTRKKAKKTRALFSPCNSKPNTKNYQQRK